MAEWKRVKLGNVADVSWGDTSTTKAKYVQDGFVSYSASGPDGMLPYADFDCKGIVLSAIGANCGQTWLAKGKWNCIKNTIRFWSVDKSVDTEFLYWRTRSRDFWPKRGSAQPFISQEDARNLIVSLPPLPTQRKIAAVLGALDDKIKNNRKICANLEVQAQALFKSWFVDFEPFGGKMPNGWKLGKLGDLGTIVGGATPSKANKSFYTENGIHWVTPKDLSIQQTKFVSRGEIDITDAGFNAASVRMMPRGSVLFSSRAPIGYVAIAKNDICTNQGFKSVVPNPGVGSEFIYQLLCANTKLIEERASGSTFKEISTAGMRDVPVVVPSKEVLGKFSNMLSSQSEIQESKEAESRALAATRDALLPKLMSGEIDVEKVEV